MKTKRKKTTSASTDSHVLTRKVAAFLCFCRPEPSEERGRMAGLKLRRLCSRLRRRSDGGAATLPTSPGGAAPTARIATFNAAMFSVAPAVPHSWKSSTTDPNENNKKPPKSILKKRSFGKSKHRVSINLPHNEISLLREKSFNSPVEGRHGGAADGGRRSILEVLREVGADILSLQNVRAEEEKGMSPLSDLAEGLGMNFVFAESWAPQYGNAILSRWPIKRWKVQKISDDSDFRNVLKATVEVPRLGEITVHCTHLDHLSESWRLKQINSILRSSEGPHILAGGLNALDETDYSEERWNDIVKYHEEIGKPTPKVQVMKFLKEKGYVDAKDFAGECEAIVVLAKGQNVQGTCKYGTRVDYTLNSPDSPFEFVPRSYSVLSSKGTSDHHIVKVDIRRCISSEDEARLRRASRQKIVKMDGRSPSGGVWAVDPRS